MYLTILDFPTQAANIKGRNDSDVLQKQVPRGTTPYNLAPTGRKATIFIPLRQDFTVANAAASAATPTVRVDYPIAAQPSSTFAVTTGSNIIVYYSTDGSTFSKGTAVTAAPSAEGEYQIVSLTDGDVKVYVPASATRYFRVYFRPAEGRLSLVKKPSVESQDEFAKSLWDMGLATLHTMDQIRAGGGVYFPTTAVFEPTSYISFRLAMTDKSATQSSEANITKTVTREALFIPRTTDTTPWNDYVGVLELPRA